MFGPGCHAIIVGLNEVSEGWSSRLPIMGCKNSSYATEPDDCRAFENESGGSSPNSRTTVDNDLVYSDLEGHPKVSIIYNDQAGFVDGSGSSAPQYGLREAMKRGREDIKHTEEKLSASLNTPIVDKEVRVLESGAWLMEHKDLTHRRSVLPPIPHGKQVKARGMAFSVH